MARSQLPNNGSMLRVTFRSRIIRANRQLEYYSKKESLKQQSYQRIKRYKKSYCTYMLYLQKDEQRTDLVTKDQRSKASKGARGALRGSDTYVIQLRNFYSFFKPLANLK